ncbi:hypothetical protein HMPREF1121_00878 [Porphyromonas sp. KLE 1280]|nr:hypothetical protein HMPREF1121_00878 [Porphyromonas sp. KLE 1280]
MIDVSANTAGHELRCNRNKQGYTAPPSDYHPFLSTLHTTRGWYRPILDGEESYIAW